MKRLETSDSWGKFLIFLRIMKEVEAPESDIESLIDKRIYKHILRYIAFEDNLLVKRIREAKSIGIFDNKIIPIGGNYSAKVSKNTEFKIDFDMGVEKIACSVYSEGSFYPFPEEAIVFLNGTWAKVVTGENI